jgi:RNA polymerase sigma-70 factor (ECF subfamily)
VIEDRRQESDKRWFATTRWSLVVAAGDSRHPDSRDALATLCQDYWPPIYSYVRSRGHDSETARDLTQGFFARLLEKGYLKEARRDRGRFRSFLLTSVKHFLANEWDREQALKRGGGTKPLSLDVDTAEERYCPQPADGETPDKIFEKRWALTVLDQVLERLEREMKRSGNVERFERFRTFLTSEGGGARYRQLAGELDMSEAAVKVAIHRLRRRFGELLREEVAQTVNEPGAVDGELRYLFSVLSS